MLPIEKVLTNNLGNFVIQIKQDKIDKLCIS